MKTTISFSILITVIITFLSCSSDNSNETRSTQQKTLSKIMMTSYNFDNQPETLTTTFYENNRPKIDSVYNISNDYSIYFTYT